MRLNRDHDDMRFVFSESFPLAFEKVTFINSFSVTQNQLASALSPPVDPFALVNCSIFVEGLALALQLSYLVQDCGIVFGRRDALENEVRESFALDEHKPVALVHFQPRVRVKIRFSACVSAR